MKEPIKLTLEAMCVKCGVTYPRLQEIAIEQKVALSVITKMHTDTPAPPEDVKKIFDVLTKETRVVWNLSTVSVKIEEDEDAEGDE